MREHGESKNEQGQTERICIVGAGSAGLAVDKELLDCGIAFDCLERDDKIGGIWNGGVYDSTHLISSRDTTAFDGFPMPCDYPDFPSRKQMVAYIRSFAKHFDLERYVQLKTEVRQIEPVDKNGMVDWRVRLVGGETRNYSALAPGIANLYFNGLVTPRGGNQPIHSATGKLIASCEYAQWSLDHPIVDEFAESWTPESRIDYVPELIQGVKCSMHVSEGIVRRHDPTDS